MSRYIALRNDIMKFQYDFLTSINGHAELVVEHGLPCSKFS